MLKVGAGAVDGAAGDPHKREEEGEEVETLAEDRKNI